MFLKANQSMPPSPHPIPYPSNSLSPHFQDNPNFLLRVTAPCRIWSLPVPLASSSTLPCSYCLQCIHTGLFVPKIHQCFPSLRISAFAISSVNNVLPDLIMTSPLFLFSLTLNVTSQRGLLQPLNQK